ncbi:hypothetical protein A2707_02925 [Candidatus Saccharibacteria bacterium RIFCSPHIGHO2_01_FULL_45_15]|jgi:hypothetical protein|nr:MAG: hypothetical protein A2707_02925 [Candidatus Saccharibacteria bacterium RIFCSPHIGHO2_01_FULL_45_15]OGL27066.1 MAG: hypothetical protein A3C39_00775 [Candidatus Saccharibacteria bacterium RIFCSPHIGHO2_02_FULL_46_12]OGL31876.1 MAG: hypothetical protein A3E76_03520 [Candidatus Saccharibacteria bacterium RIFCSPHIGHO2_12_FULL_44_22]
MIQKTSRLLSLDYLRGFFIVVIIIDHLYRFPSLYAAITGEGRLWVTAAEGFVIISGLLIGYVRGYKNKQLPLLEVSKKIWMRALLLYIWLIIATFVYTLLIWYIPTSSGTAWVPIAAGDWGMLFAETLTMSTTHVWVYFLHIYALLLAFTPLVIWLLRRDNVVGILLFTAAGYILGRVISVEWLQWMPLFYIPAIAGYYLPAIQQSWQSLTPKKRTIYRSTVFVVSGLTLVASIICIFVLNNSTAGMFFNDLFTKQYTFNSARVLISLLWFIALALLFERYKDWIGRYLGWLLLPFGIRSLTAYITHGIVLFILAYIFIDLDNIWYNTAIGSLAILLAWVLVKQKIVQRYIPQ